MGTIAANLAGEAIANNVARTTAVAIRLTVVEISSKGKKLERSDDVNLDNLIFD